MAYIPKNKRAEKPESSTKKMDAGMQDIFDALEKLNPDATFLDDKNSLSIVNEWIDTGCYALNVIFSGSLYKGIPRGRITGFSGPPQCGKTLIINKIIANAQKDGYFAAVWDTEIAMDKSSAVNVGVDTSRVKYYPVETIEDCRNQIATFLDKIIAKKDPNLKVILAIDSVGNLSSAKEIRDVQEGKDAADMGSRAKALKAMMRALTYKAAKAKVPIVFSNHTYDNPAAMHPSLVKTASGGSGPIYLASLLVQLATRQEKITDNLDEKFIPIAHNVSGVTLSALTVKNRFIPPFLKTELYNNYRTGLDTYAGLKDIAIGFKVIIPINEGGKTYEFQGEKIGYASAWENDAELWKKVLPELEKVLERELRYNLTGDKQTPDPELVEPPVDTDDPAEEDIDEAVEVDNR